MTEEQPRRQSRCPDCGADATDESLLKHNLSDVGYLHDDQTFECSECGNTYPHGVPVGEFDLDADDLWCDVCDLGFMRVHRAERVADGELVGLHLKCPHHHPFDCPECDTAIDADGIQLTKAGGRLCPHCDRHLDRAAIPFCFFFRQTNRRADQRRALIGYPDITGSTADATSYGYDRNDAGEPIFPEDAAHAGAGTLISRIWPGGCPSCTADDLRVSKTFTPGEFVTGEIWCETCGASEAFTDDPGSSGEDPVGPD